MSRTVTVENANEIEPYKSIINLLVEFKDGLEPMHFRYALMPNGGGLKDYTKDKCKRKFTKYLGREDIEGYNILDKLFDEGKISNNHISKKEMLTYYLRKLETLGILFRDKRFSNPHYKIVQNYINLLIRIAHQDAINSISPEFIYLHSKYGTLYGISDKSIYSLDRKYKSFIMDGLKEVDTKLEEIILHGFFVTFLAKWLFEIQKIFIDYGHDDLHSIIFKGNYEKTLNLHKLCLKRNLPDIYETIRLSREFRDVLYDFTHKHLRKYGLPKLYVFDIQLPNILEKAKSTSISNLLKINNLEMDPE